MFLSCLADGFFFLLPDSRASVCVFLFVCVCACVCDRCSWCLRDGPMVDREAVEGTYWLRSIVRRVCLWWVRLRSCDHLFDSLPRFWSFFVCLSPANLKGGCGSGVGGIVCSQSEASVSSSPFSLLGSAKIVSAECGTFGSLAVRRRTENKTITR